MYIYLDTDSVQVTALSVAPSTTFGLSDLIHLGYPLHELVVLAFLVAVSLVLKCGELLLVSLATVLHSPRISKVHTMSCAGTCLRG